MNRENLIIELLREKLDIPIVSIEFKSVGGGSINETYRVIINSDKKFFLKLNAAKKFPSLFEKEKNGLEFLAKQNIIKVPEIVICENVEEVQLLLIEWIDTGSKNQLFWQKFGEQLAKLHAITNEQFGFVEDNYMGALPQCNTPTKNWIDFFIHNRLQPQIKLAEENQLLKSKHINAFEKLYLQLNNIFDKEKPSLLHGDLWSGNYMCDADSRPALIDPAVYFGHRSMDIAMTTLFGGFDKQFYESYNYHFPFPDNYREQWEVCNLYPLLIHLNLFGSSYLSQIERILKKIM